MEQSLRTAVIWARTVLAALEPLPEVQDVRFLGISAGGIFGAILVGLEPRIVRTVLVFPGGDLASLVEISDEESVTAYRESHQRNGVSPRQLSQQFARSIRTEPLLLAKHVDPSRLLIVLGASDTAVPIAGGLALRDALGRPETWVLSGNHETAALCFGFVLKTVDAFLLEDVASEMRLAAD